jgi:hypothetical protein
VKGACQKAEGQGPVSEECLPEGGGAGTVSEGCLQKAKGLRPLVKGSC